MKLTGLMIVTIFFFGGSHASPIQTSGSKNLTAISILNSARVYRDHNYTPIDFGPSRRPKPKLPCYCCGENDRVSKRVIPTQHGKKKFSSKMSPQNKRRRALTKCRKTCVECNDLIRGTPTSLERRNGLTKEFCSLLCLKKTMKGKIKKDRGENQSLESSVPPRSCISTSQLFSSNSGGTGHWILAPFTAISDSVSDAESAEALVGFVESKVPPQPATEPVISTTNNEPRVPDNDRGENQSLESSVPSSNNISTPQLSSNSGTTGRWILTPLMIVSGSASGAKSAVDVIDLTGSSVPSQPAIEPVISTTSNEPRVPDNDSEKHSSHTEHQSPAPSSIISNDISTLQSDFSASVVAISSTAAAPAPKNRTSNSHPPSFDWELYLKITNSTAAPNDCFAQSEIPPKNDFKVGMKLKIGDVRRRERIRIATVVQVLGSRLRLRLDDSYDKYGFWRVVDSDELYPIGYAAPAEIFESEPIKPRKNMFEIGQMLEALDKKNPELIRAATVVAINGDMIHVIFVGWRRTHDEWYRYDSRDIFPVGWCYKSGHPLEPPGPELTVSNSFESGTSNVLPAMAVSGSGVVAEPAQVLVSPAASRAPSQPATEPVISTTNNKPRVLDNVGSEEHLSPAASGVFSNDIRALRSRSRSSLSAGVADLSISDVSPAIDRSNERSSNFQPPSFDWELYLKQTNSEAAPTDRFAQNEEPLKNDFKIGMKLKALDPRTLGATCIATVVDTVGPRLRLTLDGSKGNHDLWRLVDSDEIHPIDRFEASGDIPQPPLGFRYSPIYWPKFLSEILNGANVAPAEIFKCSPKMPGTNMFKIGEKLEAVDKKNPHLIAVATVSDVEKEMIHITFDGWPRSFDYWCRYDSRDIFPAGWCLKNGYPLNPPGPRCNFMKPNNRFKSSTRNVLPAVAVSGSGVVAEPAVVLVGPAGSSAPPAQPAAEPVITPVPKRFKSSTSNVLPAMAVSGSGVVAEPAQVLVSPAGSSVPSQSATEPDTTMANGVSQVPNYDPEAGTSTLQSESPATRVVPKDPAEWTIEDVIHYIAINKPALAIHADIFRQHEIDGNAFLLLDTRSMMKFMGLNHGSTLMISSLIDRIKEQST